MKKKMKQLTPNQIEIFNNEFEEMCFHNDFDFVYEHQIPNSAIMLLDGELLLLKRNKIVEVIKPGILLGVHQLLNNEPVRFACKISRKSKAILLNKSTLMDTIKNKKSPLFEILKSSVDGILT